MFHTVMQNIIEDKYQRYQIRTQKENILNYMRVNQTEVQAEKAPKKELIAIINHCVNIPVKYECGTITEKIVTSFCDCRHIIVY